ncbi:hypothetical protein G4B88_030048 [Cannabis sativa]|uniref:Uncharacterized protein n=1 Tax=Cannabis sativa TaxID=3483 RepID=A0A7J6FSP9_CANSA|nr:hypothetical protein G4B88_030048 [Cannabis sativa]
MAAVDESFFKTIKPCPELKSMTMTELDNNNDNKTTYFSREPANPRNDIRAQPNYIRARPRPTRTYTTRNPPYPTTRKLGSNNKPQNLNPRRHPQQPSVVEIKHAIDAGRFCEPIPSIELEEVKNMKFNVRMMNFSWVFEHPLQKKIRESDESITDQIERKFRLNGQIGLSPLLHKKPQVQIRRWWNRRDCGLTVVKGGVKGVNNDQAASNSSLRINKRLSPSIASSNNLSNMPKLYPYLSPGKDEQKIEYQKEI